MSEQPYFLVFLHHCCFLVSFAVFFSSRCSVSSIGFFRASTFWVCLRDHALDLFFICTYSFGNTILIHNFKFPLCADNSQISITSPYLFLKLQAIVDFSVCRGTCTKQEQKQVCGTLNLYNWGKFYIIIVQRYVIKHCKQCIL